MGKERVGRLSPARGAIGIFEGGLHKGWEHRGQKRVLLLLLLTLRRLTGWCRVFAAADADVGRADRGRAPVAWWWPQRPQLSPVPCRRTRHRQRRRQGQHPPLPVRQTHPSAVPPQRELLQVVEEKRERERLGNCWKQGGGREALTCGRGSCRSAAQVQTTLG